MHGAHLKIYGVRSTDCQQVCRSKAKLEGLY